MARRAHALSSLVNEVNAAFPNRHKGRGSSDGWLGDQAHQARKSDHNPNAAGVVRAQDIDEDLYGIGDHRGPAAMAIIAEHLRRMGEYGDHRLVGGASNGYIIYEQRIAGAGKGWQWRHYSGSNPHDKHIHVSVCSNPAGYDDAGSPWHVADLFYTPPPRRRDVLNMPIIYSNDADGEQLYDSGSAIVVVQELESSAALQAAGVPIAKLDKKDYDSLKRKAN